MKALTIYQPWASLIMAGAKPYEFRGWNPRQRGGAYAKLIGQRIVIHSSTKAIDKAWVEATLRVLRRPGVNSHNDAVAASLCLHADKAIPVLEEALKLPCNCNLPFGTGLGTAVLGEPRNGLDIAEEFGLPRVNDSDRDEHANFGWPMLDVEVWPEPIACRGLQGFWNWPTPAAVGL